MGGACCAEISKPEATVSTLPAPGAAGAAAGPPDGYGAGPAQPAVVNAANMSGPAPPDMAAGGEADDQFISKVGDLPQFNNNGRDQRSGVGDNQSEVSGNSGDVSEMVDGLTAKEQKTQARQIVKDFVREMVKGKKINVMKQNGQLSNCTVSLSRDLSCLKIKAGSQARSVSLTKDVEEIHPGGEVEGIDTPADELCATLMLGSGDCITFRLPDINSRDTFVYCLLMFCNGGAGV